MRHFVWYKCRPTYGGHRDIWRQGQVDSWLNDHRRLSDQLNQVRKRVVPNHGHQLSSMCLHFSFMLCSLSCHGWYKCRPSYGGHRDIWRHGQVDPRLDYQRRLSDQLNEVGKRVVANHGHQLFALVLMSEFDFRQRRWLPRVQLADTLSNHFPNHTSLCLSNMMNELRTLFVDVKISCQSANL